MTDAKSAEIPIAVRAYACGNAGAPRRKMHGRRPNMEPSDYWLVFDTETTVDATQRLRFGSYQVWRSGEPIKTGLFYDPQTLSQEEVTTLIDHAARKGLAALTRDEFIKSLFYEYAYDLGALCIGFNLPFDISRIAVRQGTTKTRVKRLRGGFTFTLSTSKDRPNVIVKHLTGRSALIEFAKPREQTTGRSGRRRGDAVPAYRGHFVDVRTLAGALLSGSWSLESLANHLKVKHRKAVGRHGARLTKRYLDYCVRDVEATGDCFKKLLGLYESYNLSQTPVTKVLSEAGLGKAYLRQMGIRPWREVQPDFPADKIGAIMSTYFGGRSEVHIRRRITRVFYCDFLSMYPTVCVLMRLWRYAIARGVRQSDVTIEVRRFLHRVTLEDLQSPDTWRLLTVIVQVLPEDDLFPVRAKYDNSQYAIGLNYLKSVKPLWYTLADCIAAKLLTGREPTIVQAVRFEPTGVQSDLQPVNIAGNPEYQVNPLTDDLYKRLIEMRKDVKALLKTSETEEPELRATEKAIKIVANATSYGIFVELNVNELTRLGTVECFTGLGKPFGSAVKNMEEPGLYFHPLLATLLTAGARLMLAITECLAQANGLTWAFCDTDSMALAAREEMAGEEFLTRVEAVRDWFVRLNPYGTSSANGESLLKAEEQNYSGDKIEPLYCFAISAKRYALFNLAPDGSPILRKASAHGLGHLLPPYSENDAPAVIPVPSTSLGEIGVERWQYDLWYRIIEAELAGHSDRVSIHDLPGFDKLAASRYNVATPSILHWFASYNRRRPYSEQIKAFNFLVVPQVRHSAFRSVEPTGCLCELGETARQKFARIRPIAPYTDDLGAALQQCFDRETGEVISRNQLKTYREVLAQYHIHPEYKFDHGSYTDAGFTFRKHVKANCVEHIGKEANRWEEQFYTGPELGAQTLYGVPREELEGQWLTVVSESKQFSVRRLAKASWLDVAQVSRLLSGQAKPSLSALKRLKAGIAKLNQEQAETENQTQATIDGVKKACQNMSVREFARRAGVDHGNLVKVLTGKRRPNANLMTRVALALGSDPH